MSLSLICLFVAGWIYLGVRLANPTMKFLERFDIFKNYK